MTPEQASRFRTTKTARFHGRGQQRGRGHVPRRAENFGGVQDRRRRRVEPAQRVPVLRYRTLLPPRLQAPSGAGMAAALSMASSTNCKRGAKVADVGCGHGVSTRLMAEAFPNSRFFGFDYHPGSIEAARKAADAGLRRSRHFDVHSPRPIRRRATTSSASSIACTTWAIRSAHDARARDHGRDGTCMLVEPFADDTSRTTSIRSDVSTMRRQL